MKKLNTISFLVICLLAFCILLSCNNASTQNGTINMPMRDGIKLATELYFPENSEGPWPVILIRTPYSRKSQKAYGEFFSSHGFVVAIQDVRGQFNSGGDFELWNNEKQDGYDAVEWLADQEWSTGKVGMVGGSYGGWVQLAAAAENPPHLVTIIPVVTMGDPCGNHVYPSGVLHLTQHLQAISLFESRFGKGGDKYELQSDWQNQLNALPVIDLDLKLFGEKNKQWREHILHKPFDPYWEKSNVLRDLEKTNIPVFLIGGWYDFGGIGTKEAYLHLVKSANPNIKLLIGPWTHHNLGKSKLGPYDFGEEANVDIYDQELQWFNHWLKDSTNKLSNDSLVSVFAVGPNKWIKSNSYPLPQSDTLKLFLSGNRNDSVKPRKLTFDYTSSNTRFETYKYEPANPTPYIWYNNFNEFDSMIGSRNDLLIYETSPFDKDYQVIGPVSSTIYASSSAKDTDWFVYYFLVDSENNLQPVISRGQLRARYRNPEKGDQLLEKNEIYKYELDLWHNSFQIHAGYKIRVVLCSSSFPHFSRNLNTGKDNETDTSMIIAEQKIYHSKKYSSSIEFPIVNLIEDNTSK